MRDVIRHIFSIDGLLAAITLAAWTALWASMQFGWWL